VARISTAPSPAKDGPAATPLAYLQHAL
jgi:hypothetical protein